MSPISLSCDDCGSQMPNKTWRWTKLEHGENFCLCPPCFKRFEHEPQPERLKLLHKARHHKREVAIEAISKLVQDWEYDLPKTLVELSMMRTDGFSITDFWFIAEGHEDTPQDSLSI